MAEVESGIVNITCPLSGSVNVSLIELLKVSDLVHLYDKDFGIDVAPEFNGLSEIGFYHCTDSDLKFFHPMVTGSENFYEGLQKHDWYYQDDKAEFSFASQFIKETDKVLEVGSGKGAFAERITAKDYLGLEFSQEAKRLAAERGVKVINESIQNHAAANPANYDVVCSFQVLEHVSGIHSFIKSSIACLKPGGLIIYSVPSADSYLSLASNGILNMPPHHVSWWSDACLKYVARAFGLDIISIEHEKLAEIHNKSYAAFVALQAVKNLIGLKGSLLDRSLKYRLSAKVAAWAGKFLEKGLVDSSMLPIGQSVTVVYRKPMSGS